MRKKIRICYIIDTFYGVFGGTEKQVVQLINRLDREKFEVHLCCLYSTDYFPPIDKILNDCSAKILNYKGFLKFNFISVLKELVSYFKEHHVDIVHTFMVDSVYAGTLAAKFASVPVIITSRRSMGYWYSNMHVFLLRHFNKFATSICVNSHAVREMVVHREKCPADKITVIYNGIDIKPFLKEIRFDNGLKNELGIDIGQYVIGMVANLRRVKGIETFLEALRSLKKDNFKFKAVIVGGEEPAYGAWLRRHAKQLGLNEDIVFVGKQDNVIPYLRVFDVGVLTSHSEGFSNSILEYMAARLPIVATATGGNSELIDGRNGYLVPVGDSQMLAAKIKEVFSNEERRLLMGKASFDKVSTTYCWENIINIWETYYPNLMGNACP